MVIEKPGLARNDPIGAKPGSSEDCSDTFRSRYSLDDWAQVIERAIADHSGRVTGGVAKIALIGISEGSDTVARLSARGFRGPIASIGGGCTGTMSALLASAVAREREKRAGPSVSEVEAVLKDIRAQPDAWGRFAFGHTFMRYATFGAQCDLEGLANHPDKVFIAYGTMDDTDVLGLESTVERRNRAGLPVRLVRVRGGDHGLQIGSADHLKPTMRAFVEWGFSENSN
jgi:pimeloyl-ACP methyl ester carboxylesterase